MKMRRMSSAGLHTVKKIGIIMCLLLMSVGVFAKDGTPYSLISSLWREYSKDTTEITLLTIVPQETLMKMSPQIEKALKIKNEVTYDSVITAGDVLTAILKEKYGKKSNAKNDFLAIQYSSSSEDFNNYLEKWPDSKFSEEAKARMECFKENELWVAANKAKTRDAFEKFAEYSANHPAVEYEGCQQISRLNRQRSKAICEWYALADRSKGKDYSIYMDYSEYIKSYGDSSPFVKAATDSLNLNKDRYDWAVASLEDTPAAYRNYIENHENGRYAWKAKSLMKELELWEKAEKSDEYKDYCSYYSEYPDGRFAEKAAGKIEEYEKAVWEAAKKKNTLKAYEDFVKEYPSGYYVNEAQNLITKLRLAPYLKNPPSFNSISAMGYYSHPGYSLVCLGNVDRSITITVSLTGPTGFSKSIKPGGREWVRVKNGTYKILVQASNVQNWWGNASFENRMYADAWSTSTSINGATIFSNKDAVAVDRLLQEIKTRAEEEELNTLRYILQKE